MARAQAHPLRPGVVACAACIGALPMPASADGLTLRPEIAAPLAVALTLLDDMCAHGMADACTGAKVLLVRQERLIAANASCARGRVRACNGLATAGYELEALASALARVADRQPSGRETASDSDARCGPMQQQAARAPCQTVRQE